MTNVIKYGKSDSDKIEFATKNASIIGGNGSGKSALMRKLKEQNPDFVIISAHKNLTIKQDAYRGQEYDRLVKIKDYFEGPSHGGNSPGNNNSMQIDFNQMIELAFRDYVDISVEALNSGKTVNEIDRKLDQVLNIWNSIFLNRRILYKDKKIKVYVAGKVDEFYDIEDLSDGERVVLYILLKLILSTSTTILIDEPETFLNPAILNQLFDECERINENANFIYFSHDLEFVTTRKDNTIFWIKEYNYPDQWEILPIDAQKIPEELIVRVIGSKKQKILFVESDNNKDAQLYQQLYPDFKIWAVGGCENVINYTKAFNSRTEKFNKEYFGLIDRDLRSSDQLRSLEQDKIFSLPVAVYENLYLNKEIVKFVFSYLGRTDFKEKFSELEAEVKSRVQDDNFKIGYLKAKIQQHFNQEIELIAKNKKPFAPDFVAYENEINAIVSGIYENILKSFNQKNLKGCVSKLDFAWSAWQNQILNIFNTDKSEDFRKKFLKLMPKIK